MPRDQWDYLPDDDEVSEGAPELPAEETALHLDEVPSEPPVADPGRSDVDTAREPSGASVTASFRPRYFPDEVPEDQNEAVRLERAEDGEDLEEMLEEQHYAFPVSDDDS